MQNIRVSGGYLAFHRDYSMNYDSAHSCVYIDSWAYFIDESAGKRLKQASDRPASWLKMKPALFESYFSSLEAVIEVESWANDVW